jgi:hypothetical protein
MITKEKWRETRTSKFDHQGGALEGTLNFPKYVNHPFRTPQVRR